MIDTEEFSDAQLLSYILQNRSELAQSAEENILARVKELAYEEGIHGTIGLALSVGWERAYAEFDVSEHRFLRRHEVAEREDFCITVNRDGELVGGEQALIELRREIQEAIENQIADLRDDGEHPR